MRFALKQDCLLLLELGGSAPHDKRLGTGGSRGHGGVSTAVTLRRLPAQRLGNLDARSGPRRTPKLTLPPRCAVFTLANHPQGRGGWIKAPNAVFASYNQLAAETARRVNMINKPQDPGQDPGSLARSAPTQAPHPGLNRRALLRAGAGASPVLLSLAAGPVLAARPACTVASSFVSVATFRSRNPHVTSIQCSTQTADYWRDQALHVTPTPAA